MLKKSYLSKFKLPIYLLIILLLNILSCKNEWAKEFKVYSIQNETEVPAGASGSVKIQLDIPRNFHIYGNPKGPGTGKPTTVKVQYPNNFLFEAARYLHPKKYYPPGESKYVWIYEKETSITINFSVKNNTKPGKYKIKIFLESLLCNTNSCTPKDFIIVYTINVIPRLSKELGKSSNQLSVFDKSSQTTKYKGKGKPEKNKHHEISSFTPIYIAQKNISNIFIAIFYGLLAGFILNFMPCVIPVVSLKIMALIKHAGEDKKTLSKLGFTFTLGILTTFVILAFLAAYLGYKWGELFQMRIFLITMIAIVFTLALSMFNLFTINIPAFAGRLSKDKSNQYTDAFIKGFLATLLATPCSGPFLGGTLAWALTQPPQIIFIIFISVGIGMSLPYIILTSNPRLMKFIPQPGEWMFTLERIMAFLLVGTTLYLISILEHNLIIPTLWFLLFLTTAFWQYGRFGTLVKSKGKRIISKISLVAILFIGYYISFHYIYSTEKEIAMPFKKKFNIETLYQNRDSRKISIVKFTADWCPNCKLVEKTSLYTSKVIKKINKGKIDLLIADLTRKNRIAEELLSILGSHSIPFLAVFPAGESFTKPICLNDIYSENDVLKAIKMAKKTDN